jgi:hypothetical protein
VTTIARFTAADLAGGFLEDDELTAAGTDADTGDQLVVRFGGGLARSMRRSLLRREDTSVWIDAEPAATILSRVPVPALTPAQWRLLAQVRPGPRIYNARHRPPIKALEAAGLVTAAWDMDPAASRWRITVTVTGPGLNLRPPAAAPTVTPTTEGTPR